LSHVTYLEVQKDHVERKQIVHRQGFFYQVARVPLFGLNRQDPRHLHTEAARMSVVRGCAQDYDDVWTVGSTGNCMLSSCFCKWASGEVGAHHSPMYSDEKHVRQQHSPCRSHECVAVHVRVLDMAAMNRHVGHSAAGCRWRGPFLDVRTAVRCVCGVSHTGFCNIPPARPIAPTTPWHHVRNSREMGWFLCKVPLLWWWYTCGLSQGRCTARLGRKEFEKCNAICAGVQNATTLQLLVLAQLRSHSCSDGTKSH
jgi:hypothetical protein